MMDYDGFEERAAIMEFDGGMSRFEAETRAAREQGEPRWRAIGDVAKRFVEQARNQREAMAQRPGADNVPGVQRWAAKENRSMPERDGS